MAEPTSTPAVPLSLIARFIGVITSPKATFQNVVAAPRPAGILLVVALVIGVASAVPQFTESGRQMVVDAQLKAASGGGNDVPPEVAARIEGFSAYLPYITLVSSLIFLPLMSLIMTGLYWALFNTVLGGTATFKEALAVVTHSQVIGALGVVAALPIMLMRPTASMGGPFNLAALLPMLEPGSMLAAFLGNVSVFSLWGVFVTAIGLGVLYRRKTAGVFAALMVLYLLITYVWTTFSR